MRKPKTKIIPKLLEKGSIGGTRTKIYLLDSPFSVLVLETKNSWFTSPYDEAMRRKNNFITCQFQIALMSVYEVHMSK